MSTTVGTRELKTRLGSYLRLVRSGKVVVVTDRGRPVAELRPIAPSGDDEEAVLRELAALGRIRLGSGDEFPPLRPVRLRSGSLSDAVLEDRGDRI